MENSSYHTPKRNQMNSTKNNLNTHLSSLKKNIKRRKSYLPLRTLHLVRESYDNSNKKVYSSLKKQNKKSFVIESIPEEKEKIVGNNSQKDKEYQNNYFINLIKNVYTNESHLNKDNILNLKKKYTSNEDLFDKRLSENAINFNILPIKNQKINDKDKLKINSNLKVPSLNNKLIQNITHYFDKNNLSEKEKNKW